MGVSYNVYVGPYVEITGNKELVTAKIKRQCPNHTNTNQHNNKFCSECGSLIESVEYDEKTNVTPAEYFFKNCDDNIYDRIWSPEGLQNIFLSNCDVPDLIIIDSYMGKYHNVNEIEDPENLSLTQRSWFFQEHKKEINTFIEMFGTENVKVKWGVISYVS